MQVYITEKPSVGKAIVNYFNKNGANFKQNKGFYIDEAKSSVVTWAYGHLTELYPPEKYDPELKSWKLETLPIVPAEFKRFPKAASKDQYKLVTGFIKDATTIIHMGDPDREGQYLIDNLITSTKGKYIKRVLLNALDDESIRKAIDNTRNNSEFKGLSEAAAGRDHADWLIGMNLTRFFTIIGRQGGFTSTFNVGRVKSPTLHLIVKRELEIKNFVEKIFYTVNPILTVDNKEFPCSLEDNIRFESKEEATIVANYLNNQFATVEEIEEKTIEQSIKELYSLDTLQIEANKLYGIDPKNTLAILQKLYEKKLTTYPRSDCKYLPESQFTDYWAILTHLISSNTIPSLEFKKPDDIKNSPTPYNDKKVTAHHAIIPTLINVTNDLKEEELLIYNLIAKKFASMFLKPYTYHQQKITFTTGQYNLTANVKNILDQGYKVLYTEQAEDKEDPTESIEGTFNIQKGNNFAITSIHVKEGKTTPPKRYTEGTIIKAMNNVTSEDKKLAEILKESKGIGTPATRAKILDDLLSTEYITKQKKYLIPTEKGLAIDAALPDSIKSPDFTAKLEITLDKISQGTSTLDQAMQEILAFLNSVLNSNYKVENNEHICPFCKTGHLHLKRYVDKGSKEEVKYFRCSNDKCKKILPERKGKPRIIHCPDCHNGIMLSRKSSKTGQIFYACSNYPDCKKTMTESDWLKTKEK